VGGNVEGCEVFGGPPVLGGVEFAELELFGADDGCKALDGGGARPLLSKNRLSSSRRNISAWSAEKIVNEKPRN
jgi:hypothetical protein